MEENNRLLLSKCGEVMLILLITPILGLLWFLNLVTLLKKMKDDKNYQNQKVLGAVLTSSILLLILLYIEGVSVY